MKFSLCIVIFLSFLFKTYSQEYDLIVRANGDSIACRIDSITDTKIYFEMIYRNKWRHTEISKSDDIEYKRNVIHRKLFVFKAGTSIIESPKKIEYASSIRDIQKNSVYLSLLSVNYSRMIPGKNVGFTVAGGFNFLAGAQAETTVLMGGTKHFFESGLMACYYREFYENPMNLVLIRAGYRYQGTYGFLFRIAPLFSISDGFIVFPTLSIGYSF